MRALMKEVGALPLAPSLPPSKGAAGQNAHDFLPVLPYGLSLASNGLNLLYFSSFLSSFLCPFPRYLSPILH